MKIIKPLLKSLSLGIGVGLIALLTFFILKWCGFSTADDFIRLRDQLGSSFLLWLIVALLQMVQVIFIPISNQIITVPIALVFSDELLKVFLASFSGIVAGSIVLYIIGRFGGGKLLSWVLGDKEKADNLTKKLTKTKYFYPVAMLIPFIPDDILSVLAGTCRFNFFYVIIITTITRAICVAASVWGFGYLTQFWWGWMILGIGGVLLLVATLILWKRSKNNG